MARRGGRVGFFLLTHGHDGDVGESSVSCGGCCAGVGEHRKRMRGCGSIRKKTWHAAALVFPFFPSALVRVARFSALMKHACSEEKMFFNLSQLNIL